MTVPKRHPDRWRYDAAGNLVMKALRGCSGQFCHEYDHIIPYSKGGHTIIRNCQVLQTHVNKMKSNRTDLTEKDLREYSIKKEFRGNIFQLIIRRTIRLFRGSHLWKCEENILILLNYLLSNMIELDKDLEQVLTY